MITIPLEPICNIGDTVYFNNPDGGSGIVVDIWYSFRNRQYTYNISTGFGSEATCYEIEISKTKVFV